MKMLYGKIGRQHGFTLIELVATIAILAFTLTLLIPFFQAVTHSGDPIIRERTVALGQALMDEVLARRWDENTPIGGGPLCTGESGVGRGTTTYGTALAACPDSTGANRNASAVLGAESGEDRQNYDDVDDYNGMVAETDNFTDQAGVAFTYAGYSRMVAVDYVSSSSVAVDAASPAAAGTTDTKRIRVTVTNPIGERRTFVALVCNL